jgi:hypothetical protein
MFHLLFKATAQFIEYGIIISRKFSKNKIKYNIKEIGCIIILLGSPQ